MTQTAQSAGPRPETFRIILSGDRISSISLNPGQNYRGWEKTAEANNYTQNLYLTERIDSLCSQSNGLGYCQAVEELAGVAVSRRSAYLRVLGAELERQQYHWLWFGLAAREIGFNTLFMYIWRDRERLLDCLSLLGGNRINCGFSQPGGVKRDITPLQMQNVRETLDFVSERNKYYLCLAQSETMLIRRLVGVGQLSREEAERLDLVGPEARACGLRRDVRLIDPYAAYDSLSPEIQTKDRGDLHCRLLVRLMEIDESVKLARQCLDELPEGTLTTEIPRKLPMGEVCVRVEAPLGETVFYLRSNGSERPERLRVRTAVQANLCVLERMLRGSLLADAPVLISSLDPSFAAADRCIVVGESGQEHSFSWQQLRDYGHSFYRRLGISAATLGLASRPVFSLGGRD